MQDLTGFSHGAAGIGWSLLELYKDVAPGLRISASDGKPAGPAVGATAL